jgi:hypothetical protein
VFAWRDRAQSKLDAASDLTFADGGDLEGRCSSERHHDVKGHRRTCC